MVNKFWRALSLATADFFTPKLLFLCAAPLIFGGVLMLAFILFGGIGIFEFLSAAGADGDIWASFFALAFIKWLISASFVAIGLYALPTLSLIIALIISSFLTPSIASFINSRHYQLELNSQISTAKTLGLSAVVLGKFLLIFIACLPLVLVPLIGIVALNIPLFYLYYKLLSLDVASCCLSELEFKQKSWQGELLLPCLCFYLLCLVPFVGIFLQPFFVAYLAHLLFLDTKSKASI